jgi:hypothetical protein
MRPRTTVALAALLCLPLLADCSKPVTYYAAHADERTARVQICLDEDSDSQNCRNATQAESDIFEIKGAGRAPARPVSLK